MGERRDFESAECGFAPLVTDYALGELRGQKRRAFARHLDGCAACRSELAEVEILLERLREEARSPTFRAALEPPRDLERRVLGRLSEARRGGRRSLVLRAA
ncbi:MAG: zf-HC2 domain-containing protein, partial [Planctomycetota bacterium]